jgi:site-specific recombinase XerD
MNTLTDNTELEIFAEYLVLKGYSTTTRHAITKTLINYSSWAEQENLIIEEANHNDIMGYVNHCKKLGNKQRTVQINVGHLKHYYNFLISRDQLNQNPCSDIDIKGVKRKILYETFTPQELDDMYKKFCSTPPAAGGIGSKLTHKRNKIIPKKWEGLK